MVVLVMSRGRRVKKAPYFRMFVGYWQDRRVMSVSADAEHVWLRSIAYSKDNRLNGFMPDYALLFLFAKLTTPPSLITDELVTAGLWRPIDGGWQIEHFIEYQTTAEEDDAEREGAAKRKRDQRERERNQPQLPLNGDHQEDIA